VSPELVVRSPLVLRPDPGRVIARQFLPGQEVLADGRARVDAVVDRVQEMSEAELRDELDYEQQHKARPAHLTLLSNRLATLDHHKSE